MVRRVHARGRAPGRLGASALLAALALLGPGPAAAEQAASPEAAVLGLVVPPTREGLGEALTRTLDEAAARAGLSPTELSVLSSRRGEALAEASARAVALRAEARRHFMGFRFAQAAEALDVARRTLVEAHGDLLRHPALAEICLDLARVYLDLGEPDAAARILLDLARIDPAAAPDPADYPPALVEAHRRALEAAEAGPAAASLLPADRLAVAARELGLAVAFTGSVGPGAGGGLVALIRVADLRGAQRTRSVEVPLDPEGGWTAALGRALAAALAPRPVRPVSPPGPATALFVLTTPPGAAVAVDGAPRVSATPATLEVPPGLHHLRLTAAGHRPSELLVMAWDGQIRPVEVTLRPIAPRTLARAWWLWTIVSLAAAGAAVGIALWAVSASEDLPDARITVSR